ncbi:MAG: class I SAM-dependent methyltransferase [Candidatus Binatus sp.]|uniref:class I SAM-dependent methyltransferase n=1 Tax=Candidatus Binatus sp. TaxID=2811406 RepID=UPI003C7125E2
MEKQHDSHHHGRHHHGAHGDADRHGARQPERFDPARAALLDDPSRFGYLPPDEIFAMLAAPAGSRVVDFGTGIGTYAIELARSRPDLEVIALDEQQEMLDLLRAKPEAQKLSNLSAVHTDEITKLNGTADRVLALNVLHEVGDEALRAMAALLKPTGTVLVVDWNAGADRPAGPPRDHVYTASEARERMERIGLRIEGERMFKYHYALLARRA